MAEAVAPLTCGPFVGVSDVLNLAGQDGSRASYIENMYVPGSAVAGDLISRPGVTRLALGTVVTRTGTVSTGAMTVNQTGVAVTGTLTLFLTELAVGDIIVANGAEGIVTAIATNTACTVQCEVAGTMSGAYTYYPAGIKTGPIYGTYRYANSDGTIQRFILASTSAVSVNGAGPGRYRFRDSSATQTALTGTVANGGFANGATTVTGSGTLFSSQVTPGSRITFQNLGPDEIVFATAIYFTGVKAVASNTSLTTVDGNQGTGSVSGPTMTVDNSKIRLLTYDPSNTTHPFTDRTSATMNDVLLDTSQRIYGITFANYLILSDGVNRPRKITSVYVLSNLTDGNYAAKGALVQYYGKLFFIDASDAITLRWSEENDPDTGYGTGTSSNSWALRQTSADPLECLGATNAELYAFRSNSTAVITGAANSDFASSGTVDAIQNIGCRSPDSVQTVNSSVVFLDQYCRPGRITPGLGYVPLWTRIQETIRGAGVTAANLRAAWGRYDPVMNLVKFGYRMSAAATTNAQMIVIEPERWECLGVHKWYSASTTAMDHAFSTVWEDENSVKRHVVASGVTTDLQLSIQKTEITLNLSAKDTLAAGDQTVSVVVETPKLGGDPLQDKTFSRLAVNTRNVGGGTAGITLWKSQYKTANVTAYTTAEAMFLGGNATVPSDMTLDGACVKAEQQGVNARGRWLQAKFTNDITGNPATRATFDTVTLIAVPRSSDYAIR